MKADPAPKPGILILASGSGTNFQALVDASRQRDFPGDVVAVGCNNPQAFVLERAARSGIESFTVNHRDFDSREAFDAALLAHIQRYNPDVILLAGFMRILTTDFVRAFRGRLLNIHPSLLPRYTGLNTHQRALDAGDVMHGVSIHFVTEELDGGPVIAQAQVAIEAEDTADILAEKVQQKEHLLYPIVLRWFCEGRLSLSAQDQVLFDGETIPGPLVLPEQP